MINHQVPLYKQRFSRQESTEHTNSTRSHTPPLLAHLAQCRHVSPHPDAPPSLYLKMPCVTTLMVVKKHLAGGWLHLALAEAWLANQLSGATI